MTRSGLACSVAVAAFLVGIGSYGCGSDSDGTGDTDGSVPLGGSGTAGSGGGATGNRDGGVQGGNTAVAGATAGSTGNAGTTGGSQDGGPDGPSGDGPRGGSGGSGNAGAGGRGGTGGMATGGTGGVPAAQCQNNLTCTGDCSRSCFGGQGTVRCTCGNNGRLTCGQCQQNPPPACPAMPEGKACDSDDAPQCSLTPDAGADGRCFCQRGEWSCPSVPDACPADPVGKTCEDAGELCSAGANQTCVCAQQGNQRRWLCF